MTAEESLFSKYPEYIHKDNSAESDYFSLIRKLLVSQRESGESATEIDALYALVEREILSSDLDPVRPVSFGTSGWRGVLGKDITLRSVAQVTRAIVEMYEALDTDPSLASLLGFTTSAAAKKAGCIVGHDNRFAGPILGNAAAGVLSEAGFKVFYAGESTTGVLSAAVMVRQCAFSVNLTPSHNPLEYGGYKFNAFDGGPAEKSITERITTNARRIIDRESGKKSSCIPPTMQIEQRENVSVFDSFSCWDTLVCDNEGRHGLNRQTLLAACSERSDLVIAIDCVHGASRLHIRRLLGARENPCVHLLRDSADVTFGGVSPEPSSKNMQGVIRFLASQDTPLKIGAVIDPDGDRIRFTDGSVEINMNQFGALAYHFLHTHKKKKGLVAKTVATSNLANEIAAGFGEEIFEPAVGFKNFKPVIGRALVLFEESDGISILGHTPEKDAYIGLILALDMVLTTGINLGDYQRLIEKEFGAYYPGRGGIAVSLQGPALRDKLSLLDRYVAGSSVEVGGREKTVLELITVDGHKMVFDDGSWIMIRPSGTEPKVRFYVESRTREGTDLLVDTAKRLLQETGVLS
ncbi:MAG: phosphoglucomutase [Deltaproteobacteria bacterium]|nr:MAG: phosphoglucomutase [Deltaproteobacteria bacterium]